MNDSGVRQGVAVLVEEYLRQLHFVSEENFWYAAMEPLLARITPAQALWRPPQGANTIWQIVHHVAYCYGHAARRLRGDEPEWNEQENWVPNPQRLRAEEWTEALDLLKRERAVFAAAVRDLAGQDLSQAAGELTRADHIVQVIQHEAYHAGQIAYIQRLQGFEPVM